MKKIKFMKERVGKHEYIYKDIVCLLRIENGLTSNYVDMKHRSRVLNMSAHVEDKNNRYCPYCNTKIPCHNSTITLEHVIKIKRKVAFVNFRPLGQY